jgi:hypothetical protein
MKCQLTKKTGAIFETIVTLMAKTGNPSRRRNISTVDLLAMTSSDHVLIILIFFFFAKKLSFKEVNCTDPFPSQEGFPGAKMYQNFVKNFF